MCRRAAAYTTRRSRMEGLGWARARALAEDAEGAKFNFQCMRIEEKQFTAIVIEDMMTLDDVACAPTTADDGRRR